MKDTNTYFYVLVARCGTRIKQGWTKQWHGITAVNDVIHRVFRRDLRYYWTWKLSVLTDLTIFCRSAICNHQNTTLRVAQLTYCSVTGFSSILVFSWCSSLLLFEHTSWLDLFCTLHRGYIFTGIEVSKQ